MTEKETMDALEQHFINALIGDYPNLKTTVCLDKARRIFVHGVPLVLLTPHSYDEGRWMDEWGVMVEFSACLYANEDKTILAATEADRPMRDKIKSAVKDDDGYRALRDAGLQNAKIKGLSEDQRGSDGLINPHIVTFSTSR